MQKICLNPEWEMRYENLSWGPEMAQAVLHKSEGWFPCDVPCDVHMPLIAHGVIKEPVEALNCYNCEWVEGKSWWFKKVFYTDQALLDGKIVELTLESLDAGADIFLNGFHLGHHRSAFFPFVADVKSRLHSGDNVLLVRVSSGLEHYSEAEIAPIANAVIAEFEDKRGARGDKRRAHVRKPQYVYGWDWAPRVPSIGIMKDVYINYYNKLIIRDVHVVTEEAAEDIARLNINMEVENTHIFMSFDCDVEIELLLDGQTVKTVSKKVHLRSGTNYVRVCITVETPKLWWPNGMGDQALYTVRTSVMAQGAFANYPDFKYGIRTIRLNMDELNDNERLFALEVNGVKSYCKGANWVPADSIYCRVTDEKYRTLISEARESNFTMLRVWGGGIYEKDVFYDCCDELGILIWQDFMFACSQYPDDQEWFRADVEREMDYQTKRLRNRACLALFCGSNENHWNFDFRWTGDKMTDFPGGVYCYNRLAPAIIEKNCPDIPYWNGSPYGGIKPNSSEIGNCHHWNEYMMNPVIEKRITPEEYDNITSKFVTEYGYIGPCTKTAIEKYHAGSSIDREGEIWAAHNNEYEKDTVLAGIKKHYKDIENLSIDEYLLYAGLVQGLIYQYSLESMRFYEFCWGSLYWMFNDAWGEVGWTTIDYYLRRKPSFYFVKRAFAHIKLILREIDDMINVMGINDTPEPISLDMECGYISFNGKTRNTDTIKVKLPAFSRRIVHSFSKDGMDLMSGVSFARPSDSRIAPALFRAGEYRRLNVENTDIRIGNVKREGRQVSFTVASDHFVHAVHFGLGDDIRLSDEYFDLLPGEERRIVVDCPPISFDESKLKATGVFL